MQSLHHYINLSDDKTIGEQDESTISKILLFSVEKVKRTFKVMKFTFFDRKIDILKKI